MKLKKIAVATVLGTALFVGVETTNAQTEITLGAASQNITFQGMGKSNPNQVSITLGQCSKSVCTLLGKASGTGLLSSGPTWYTFTSTLGSIVATLVNAAMGEWTISQSSPILFSYGVKGSLLTGDLNLLTFREQPGSTQGSFNYEGLANLVITGGSLAGLLGRQGIVNLTVTYTFKQFTSTTKNIMSLLGTTNTITGRLSGGQVLPTPEPSAAAIFLLGAAMLLAGWLLRGWNAPSNVAS